MIEEPSELDGEIRPLGRWHNVPYFIVSGFPATEKHYNLYCFQQTVTDGLGLKPFRRKPAGLILTYVLVLPALIYAFHRRHWVIRKMKDLKLRSAIQKDATAPRKIRGELDRLDAPELQILLSCLRSESSVKPRIYGHRVEHNGKWYTLPDSTFSKLVRIPEIMESLKGSKETLNCAREVEARLKVLTCDAASG